MLWISYHRCDGDHCAYARNFDDGSFILSMLYVDDMLIACRDMSKVNELKEQLVRI